MQIFDADAYISLDLKVFNNDVWEIIANRAGPSLGAIFAEGTYPYGATGALMVGEGLAYRLLVWRPYSAKATNLARRDPMRPGYNFPLAYLAGPDDIENSVRAQKIRTIFRAIPYRVPGSFNRVIYNYDTTGLVPGGGLPL